MPLEQSLILNIVDGIHCGGFEGLLKLPVLLPMQTIVVLMQSVCAV